MAFAQETSTDTYLDEDHQQDPAGNALKVVLLATAAVVISIAAFVYFGQKPPAATGEVLHMSVFPIHAESNVAAAAGMPGQNDVFDEVLILTQVRIHNQSNVPLFVHDMWADLAMGSGESLRDIAVSKSDYIRAFTAYPQLSPLQMQPIERDITISPGQTVDGMMLFHYGITREEFDKKHAMEISVSFLHQPNLTMPAPQ